MTADYNGWTDIPEDQREALQQIDEQIAKPIVIRRPASRPPLLCLACREYGCNYTCGS